MKFDDGDFLTLTDKGYKTSISDGYLKTEGATTTSSGDYEGVSNYLEIDLSDYVGATVTVSIEFSANKSDTTAHSVAISTELAAYSKLSNNNYTVVGQSSDTTKITCETSWTVEANTCYYIMYSASVRIYSITITIVEANEA